jgi:hypothetical protein
MVNCINYINNTIKIHSKESKYRAHTYIYTHYTTGHTNLHMCLHHQPKEGCIWLRDPLEVPDHRGKRFDANAARVSQICDIQRSFYASFHVFIFSAASSRFFHCIFAGVLAEGKQHAIRSINRVGSKSSENIHRH